MEKIVECVPNFSEGRNEKTIEAIAEAVRGVEGVLLLDVDPGRATNRTVFTFAGPPDAVVEAAFQAVAAAAERIDMSKHQGAHPRQGATDVCPFCPVRGVTMEECADLARRLGKRVGEELGIPVYLYEHAATRPERRLLPDIRVGEYEALPRKLGKEEWAPDFGPNAWNDRVKRTGVTVIGAREFLIAYNVNLNTREKRYASDLALEIRETGRVARKDSPTAFYMDGEIVRDEQGKKQRKEGLFKYVKAVGWYIDEYGIAQVSINLTNYKVTPMHAVFDACARLAEERGLRVTGSEIVGLVPLEAVLQAGRHYLAKQHRSTGVPEADLVHAAVKSLGLDDLGPFDPAQKIIEYRFRREGALTDRTIAGFLDEVSRDSMAPGGGSAAALLGSLGAALSAMVANLTAGKREMFDRFEAMGRLAEQAQAIKDALAVAVDRDTDAFNAIIQASRMPKKTDEEKAAREAALEAANQGAAAVPLDTARLCVEAMEAALEAARSGNPASITDAATAGAAARAGFEGAVYNVRVNLDSVKDDRFKQDAARKVRALSDRAQQTLTALEQRVEAVLSPLPQD